MADTDEEPDGTRTIISDTQDRRPDLRYAASEGILDEGMPIQRSGALRRFFTGGTIAEQDDAAMRYEEGLVAKLSRKVFGREGFGPTRDELLDMELEHGIYAFDKNTLTAFMEASKAGGAAAARYASKLQASPDSPVQITEADITEMAGKIAGQGESGSPKGAIKRLGAKGFFGGAAGLAVGTVGQVFDRRDRYARKAAEAKVKEQGISVSEMRDAIALRKENTHHHMSGGMKKGALVGLGIGALGEGKRGAEAAKYDAAMRDAIAIGIRNELANHPGIEIVAETPAQAMARMREEQDKLSANYEVAAAGKDSAKSAAEYQTLSYTPEALKAKLAKVAAGESIKDVFAPPPDMPLVVVDVDRTQMKDSEGTLVSPERRKEPMAVIPEGISKDDINAQLAIMKKNAPDANVVLVTVIDKETGRERQAFLGIPANLASAYSAHAAAVAATAAEATLTTSPPPPTPPAAPESAIPAAGVVADVPVANAAAPSETDGWKEEAALAWNNVTLTTAELAEWKGITADLSNLDGLPLSATNEGVTAENDPCRLVRVPVGAVPGAVQGQRRRGGLGQE